MTLPNFLIIGAAKAGTTSLYDWFRQHPDDLHARAQGAEVLQLRPGAPRHLLGPDAGRTTRRCFRG